MRFNQSTCYAPLLELGRGDAATPGLLVRLSPLSGLEKPIELGREPRLVGRELSCSLALPDDSVSRRHASIEHNGLTHVVTDLHSTNGTYVNELRIRGPQPLNAGDRLRFGNQIFKYLSADNIESQYHEVMFKLMTTDGLTSAYNRRYFLETCEREIEYARREGTCLAIMLLDLDHFKSINDTHGHLAGDATLVECTRRAKSQLGSGELLGRYGGEEFVVLSSRTTFLEATDLAERIRASIASEPVRFERTNIPATVSIGVCTYAGDAPTTPDALISAADAQLYRAKQNGRNQVQIHEDLPHASLVSV